MSIFRESIQDPRGDRGYRQYPSMHNEATFNNHVDIVEQSGIFHHTRTPDVAKAITFVSEKTAASCFTMKEKCIDSDKSFVVNSTSNFKVKGWHA
eukprot:scaffold2192_cov268-Chaetoceros_neogracile.AAC.88